MISRIVVGLALCLAPPVFADVPDRLEAAFRGWVADVGATRAVMTVRRAGQPVRDVAIGMEPAEPVEFASLAKAITAACVAELIAQGVWQEDTTSRDVLGYGMQGVSLAGLLTHSAGLGPDRTQKTMWMRLFQPDAPQDWAARSALERDKQTQSPGSYSYNNENYAILGAMIAAQSGQNYQDYCTQAVLAPAGVDTARASQVTGAFLPFGGWQMSVQDYAAFHWHSFGPSGRIGAAPEAWPSIDVRGGAEYGMGMFQRKMRGRYNYWHFGLLCFPARFNGGAYAVIWQETYSVVAAYDACVDFDQMGALDAALGKAVFQ